ncbi:hypothetical protein [uncultured Kordia sp.]|uniref:hypothetical protein n=1 Tax=uncultured Kordia sp. TaxID=507699 RepID=UPI0026257C46|nr:hypothetical protein [uncultured Kordia sp.]
MKKQLHILLLVCFTTYSYSQNEPIHYPNFVGKDFAAIQKNKDWSILDQVPGYLNDDARKDIAIVLESKDIVNEKRCDDCEISKSRARIVLVFLYKNGKQIVHAQNNEFMPRADEGSKELDIAPILVIENNEFIICQQYSHAFYSYKFKLQNNKLNIVRALVIQSSNDIVASDKYDFTKGIVTRKTSPVSSNEEKIKVVKFKVKPKSLSEFKQMHDWKIAKDFYL